MRSIRNSRGALTTIGSWRAPWEVGHHPSCNLLAPWEVSCSLSFEEIRGHLHLWGCSLLEPWDPKWVIGRDQGWLNLGSEDKDQCTTSCQSNPRYDGTGGRIIHYSAYSSNRCASTTWASALSSQTWYRYLSSVDTQARRDVKRSKWELR